MLATETVETRYLQRIDNREPEARAALKRELESLAWQHASVMRSVLDQIAALESECTPDQAAELSLWWNRERTGAGDVPSINSRAFALAVNGVSEYLGILKREVTKQSFRCWECQGKPEWLYREGGFWSAYCQPCLFIKAKPEHVAHLR